MLLLLGISICYDKGHLTSKQQHAVYTQISKPVFGKF